MSGFIFQVHDPNGINYYAEIVEHSGVEIINQLQNHENKEIYDKAAEIIKTYYLEEEENPFAMDNTNDLGNQFTFGNGAQQPAAPFNFDGGGNQGRAFQF